MYTQKQSRGALWMGMAAVLTITSAAAAQFQGSAAQTSVSDPSPSAGVVAGSPASLGADGQLISSDWVNLGFALSGVAGKPSLKGDGLIAFGHRSTIVLEKAAAMSLAVLVVSSDAAPKPFKGGVLVPAAAPSFQLVTLTNDGGGITLSVTYPSSLPAGLDLVMQFVIADAAAPQGVSLSNAIQTSTH
jgi:hypothetical protein